MLALAHPEVGFTLTHNGRRVAHLAPASPRERTAGVVGADFADSAVEVEASGPTAG